MRHNKVNVKTAGYWDELENWTGKFGGTGIVVRLKMDLTLVQIRRALTTWNIKDNTILKLLDGRHRDQEGKEIVESEAESSDQNHERTRTRNRKTQSYQQQEKKKIGSKH